MLFELGAGGVTRPRRGQDLLRPRLPGEEGVDFHHRQARVCLDLDQTIAGLLQAGGAGDAKKMPDGVFDVVAVDRLVKLELLAPFFVSAGVVTGDAPLPEIRRLLGLQFKHLVEVGDRFPEMGELELLDAAELVDFRGAGLQGKRLVKVRDRLGVFAAERVKATADVVTLRISRIDLDCFGGQREGIRPVTFQLGRLRSGTAERANELDRGELRIHQPPANQKAKQRGQMMNAFVPAAKITDKRNHFSGMLTRPSAKLNLPVSAKSRRPNPASRRLIYPRVAGAISLDKIY